MRVAQVIEEELKKEGFKVLIPFSWVVEDFRKAIGFDNKSLEKRREEMKKW